MMLFGQYAVYCILKSVMFLFFIIFILSLFRRYLFWSDWYRPAVIMKAFPDGSNAVPLVNTTLGWPYGLALDYV